MRLRSGIGSVYYTDSQHPERYIMPYPEEDKNRFSTHSKIYNTDGITKIEIEDIDNQNIQYNFKNNKNENVFVKKIKLPKVKSQQEVVGQNV